MKEGSARIDEFKRIVQKFLVVKNPTVVVVSDFWDDYYHAVMEGIVLKKASEARIIRFPLQGRFNVTATAWALMCSIEYFSEGSIFLVVVDPGVGTERRAIAMRFGRYFYVGPDNGIPFALTQKERGEVEVVEIRAKSNSSATFHGRDVFAPVAGEIAKKLLGQDPEKVVLTEFGSKLDSLKKLDLQPEKIGNQGIVTYIDVFGNIITNIAGELLEKTLCEVHIAGYSFGTLFHKTFDAGEEDTPFLIKGSCGTFEIVRKQGSAAVEFPQVRVGSPVMIKVKS